MSMVLTRSPLEPIAMNGTGAQKRRSARLSTEGAEENEPPSKRVRVSGVQTMTVSTKEQDGGASATVKRKQKVYEQQDDGFHFTKKGKRAKEPKSSGVCNSTSQGLPMAPAPAPLPTPAPAHAAEAIQPRAASPQPAQSFPPSRDDAPKPTAKKPRRRFPTTPERVAAEKPVRRSKRLSSENAPSEPQPSPQRPAHAKSHANLDHSPSPDKTRPVTVEKKRRKGVNGLDEEEKILRIQLPFQDTPIIRRNKEMRKSSAGGQRRTSSGMRGRRASSLIDEGRGNALPHAEVSTAEFFKHISADLTEPRRMRCLLGWCGARSLPPKPDPPKDNSPASNAEFQAMQAARVIQEELSFALTSNGTLSDWFSRDDSAPLLRPLRKMPNPRNIANAAKAEELERELERLKEERAEWDAVIHSVPPSSPKKAPTDAAPTPEPPLSPIHADLLDTPQRAILQQLQAPSSPSAPPVDPDAIQTRLRDISANLEFAIDRFAHGVHALATTREVAERLAERTLADAAAVLERRDRARRAEGGAVDGLDALKALGKVLNSRVRR